jgi:cell wall-associated NlpC family hydrolase
MSAVAAAGAAPALARMVEIRSRFGLAAPSTTATTETGASAFASLLGTAETVPGAGADLASGATASGADVLEAGSKYLGVPYVWGGTDPSRGLDCSGFVQRAYRDVGVELPRVSRDQAKVGTEVPSLDQAKPGDLIAFGEPVDHIALYAGDGKIMQAPRTGDVVKVSEIHRPITAIRRILPEGGSAATTPVGTAGAGSAAMGSADAVALRQLLQLVTRQLGAGSTGTNAATAYGSATSIGLGLGAGDQALGTMLNGGTL